MSYSTVLDCARLAGIFNQITNESIGTGDASTKSFSLDKANIVEASETIYVDNTLKTRGVDYNINNYSGGITFLTAPALSAAIVANYKYFPDSINISNDDINSMILDADSEIEDWTGKKWTNANSYTEYQSGRAKKITVQGSQEYGQFSSETQDEKYVIILSKYPVQSITSLQFLKDDGTVDQTLTENKDFHWWPSGKIQLITNTIPEGQDKKKIKIVYTYGFDSVPRNVKTLSACITGIMVLVGLTGGAFDDVRNYTLGPKTITVEDVNVTVTAALKGLEDMRDRLFNQVGREVRQVII
jgi:hypothetical protein